MLEAVVSSVSMTLKHATTKELVRSSADLTDFFDGRVLKRFDSKRLHDELEQTMLIPKRYIRMTVPDEFAPSTVFKTGDNAWLYLKDIAVPFSTVLPTKEPGESDVRANLHN